MNGSAVQPRFGDSFASRLRGFGPIGIAAFAAIALGNWLFAPLSAVLAIAWAWRSDTPWRELGFARERSWWRSALFGALFGIALKLAMKSIVMPLLGADPVNRAYSFLTGNAAAIPGMLFAIIVGAGFGEEVLFRGYFFERFGRLWGTGRWGTIATILVAAVWFGAVHYPFQRVPGVQQALVVGLVYGVIYARTRRLWFLMWSHAFFDLAALYLIYYGLETRVAGWFFG